MHLNAKGNTRKKITKKEIELEKKELELQKRELELQRKELELQKRELQSSQSPSSSSNVPQLPSTHIQQAPSTSSDNNFNIEYFADAYLPDVFNFIQNILRTNNHTADISGYCVNSTAGKEYQNVKGFVSLSAFENYRNSFNSSSDETKYQFTGNVRYGEDEFKRLRRSKHGKGEDFRFEIMEYEGENCYIPPAGNCFIRCYLHQEKKKMNELLQNTVESSAPSFEAIAKLYGILYYNLSNIPPIEKDNEGNIDSEVICEYYNEYTKNKQFALLSKGEEECGYREVLKITEKEKYIGHEYKGFNCYVPQCIPDQSNHQSFISLVCKILTQRYKTFLYKHDGDIRNGIMTLAKVSILNKFMNTNIAYFNPKDRHTYPRGVSNDDPMIVYLHKQHYCLINKNAKSAGIKEIEENYDKLVKYTRCNENNVSQRKVYKVNTKLANTKVFVWDIETFVEEDRWCKTYAVGVFPLDAVEEILGDKLNSPEPVDDETLEKMNGEAKIFCGTDLQPITDMIKYLAELNFENVTIIAHNGKGFDNWMMLREGGVVPYNMLKTGQGIVDMRMKNPYTSEESQAIFKKKFMEKKGMKNKPKGGKFLQTITNRCSFNHVKSSLSALCKSFKIPSNLRKSEMDHDNITRENFMERRGEWEPYLKLDVISLACCIAKHNKQQMSLIGQDMQSCISSPQASRKGWFASLDFELYVHTDEYVRWFVRDSIKGGRVFATIKKFVSPLWKRIEEILRRHSGGKYLGIPALMSWYSKQIDENIINKKEYDKLPDVIKQIREEINNLPQTDDDFMIPFDGTSLYPSSMWDKNSEFPDVSSARPFKCSEEKHMLQLFNEQQFRPKTAILLVKYYYPPDNFLQHLPVKETVIKGGKKYKVTRFRNGYAFARLNSVDIQEIVRTGGKIVRIYEGIVYEKNLSGSLFRSYIEKLFNHRKKCKEEGNSVGSDNAKLNMNGLYGGIIQKDSDSRLHIWKTKTLLENYDESIMSRCEIKKGLWIVQRKIERANIDVTKDESENGIISKGRKDDTTSKVPHHDGSFVLAHARRIMNNYHISHRWI
jgi:hypothetical protein